MKKKLLIAFTSLSLLASVSIADDRDRDWREVYKAQEHVRKAIEILQRARDDNRFQNNDRVETALNLLRNTSSELDDALDDMKRNRKR